MADGFNAEGVTLGVLLQWSGKKWERGMWISVWRLGHTPRFLSSGSTTVARRLLHPQRSCESSRPSTMRVLLSSRDHVLVGRALQHPGEQRDAKITLLDRHVITSITWHKPLAMSALLT